MEKKKTKFIYSIYSTHLLSLLIFILTFTMSCFFVWTLDDYFTVGIYDFKSALDYSINFGNGRFIGNFLVNFVMCRYVPDRIFRAVFIFGAILLTAMVIDGYRKRSILLSSLLYLGVGNEIFAQVFVWGHGFYNYVPPITLMLLGTYIIKRYYSGKQEHTVIVAIILGIIGISQQLFIENCTTINLIISLLMFIFVCHKKYKKAPALIYLIFNLIGTFIIFAIPEITGISEKIEGYRKIDGGIVQIIDGVVCLSNMLNSQLLLWEILSIILICLLIKKNKHKNKLILLSCIYMVVYPFLTIFHLFIENTVAFYTLDIALLLYFICVTVSLFKVFPKEHYKLLATVIMLTVLSLGQLLIVTPISTRCFFLTYVLISMLIIYINKELFNVISDERLLKINCIIVSVLCVIIYSILLFIYANVQKVDKERIKYVEEQLATGTTHIEMIDLPYEYFLYYANEPRYCGYVFNQGDKDDMTFSRINYEDYLAKKN